MQEHQNDKMTPGSLFAGDCIRYRGMLCVRTPQYLAPALGLHASILGGCFSCDGKMLPQRLCAPSPAVTLCSNYATFPFSDIKFPSLQLRHLIRYPERRSLPLLPILNPAIPQPDLRRFFVEWKCTKRVFF